MEQEILKRVDEIIGYIKQASPVIWNAYIKQQYLIGISEGLFILLFLGIFVYGIHIMRTQPKWAMNDCDENIGGYVISILSGFVSLLVSAMFLSNGLLRILNPEYYAIRALLP